MANRNTQTHGLVSRKFLCCWLFLVIVLVLYCIFSWDSTSLPAPIDHSLFPNQKAFSLFENQSIPLRDELRDDLPLNQETYSLDQPKEQELKKCDPSKAILKVFMYDMPPEFHFGLLDWVADGKSVWPDIRTKIPSYPGGLNLQHSIEYWLTLDLLSSRFPDRSGPCTAVRVEDSREADVVFVPFFSSLSYNRHSKIKPPEKVSRNKMLQQKLVMYLTAQEEWKRSGGKDHIIMAHHPNSMLDARTKLWPCMFILADFGRYIPRVANVEKDIIAPYKHVIKTFVNDTSMYDDRPTLLYFQGAIYRKDGGSIRQELFYLLRNEKDVHFSFGSVQANGINEASQGMHSSKFCLNIAGDTPSSNRLFDAITSHCVPVIISDEIELPFEDVLDYSEFCIFVRASDAVKEGFLMKLIRGISREEWTRMWKKLKEVEGYFEFQYPSRKDDAVQMIWQAVARKVPAIRLKVHRSRRFSRFKIGR
ncbi:probable arabinosyltransferase ARAD1 [Elaeis guineensis]|uniref:Probable arabinosyltransferase ARAD1 n=1 Tax=Elaeis guineensis var. tenera TaxID=51953 RepID=A0A6I9RSN8_ELAGV|nr:probable arabinosyltransferase ARAD1 [Elaeis guineensis]XP_010931459.1 probable arabinosyltransferase ARAD1 [Elaeis guineensis]